MTCRTIPIPQRPGLGVTEQGRVGIRSSNANARGPCRCAMQGETSRVVTNPDMKEPSRPTSAAAQRLGGGLPGIPLGRWGGVAVSARWSVLFTLGLFADVLATSALPAAAPGDGTAAYWLVGVA